MSNTRDEDEKLRKFISEKYNVDTSKQEHEPLVNVVPKKIPLTNKKNSNLIYYIFLNYVVLTLSIMWVLNTFTDEYESKLTMFVESVIFTPFLLIPFWIKRIVNVIKRGKKGVPVNEESIGYNIRFMWLSAMGVLVLAYLGMR